MCLTDDVDSLFSCLLLEKIKGYEISHFYSFSKLYRGNQFKGNIKLVGVDMDLNVGRCWGNHPTLNNNKNSANLNVIKGINQNNYFHKYAGSTLLEIISYYDVDISMLNEEALMVLLAVDTTFKQYAFNPALSKYYLVDVLELPQLYDLCKDHKQKEFYDLIDKYKLYKKIIMNEDNILKTSIDLNGLSELFNMSFILPKSEFRCTHTYIDKGLNLSAFNRFKADLEANGGEIFTQALTNRSFIKFSYQK
ncbi:hypothetical protein CUB90_07200 [Clostridium sp. CT7]|nr:hypothetical protein CUB90_07200 [Clostridium sp. CT7]